jgi:hypothetical protein
MCPARKELCSNYTALRQRSSRFGEARRHIDHTKDEISSEVGRQGRSRETYGRGTGYRALTYPARSLRPMMSYNDDDLVP